MNLSKAVELVTQEFRSATEKHGSFNSAHEGYAVLLEEVDELWDEVKKKTKKRSSEKLRNEAKQCAAMALRFMVDCT